MRRAALVAILVPVLVVLTGVAGCTDSGDSSDAAPSPSSVGRPTVGDCRTYDAVAAEKPTEVSGPVPCTNAHTAETFAVADGLPDPAENGTWTDEQLGVIGALACGVEPLARRLGSTADELAVTRITQAFFGPTPEQAKAGARWVRCDAFVVDERDPVLVTGKLADLAKVNGAFAQCTTQPPAAVFAAVPCRGGERLFAAIGTTTPDPADPRTPAALREACQQAWSTAVVSGSGASSWAVTGLEEGSSLSNSQTYTCWLPFSEWNVDPKSWPEEKPLAPTVAA